MLKRQNNRHYTYRPFCLQHCWQFSQWRTSDITWKNHASESIIEEKNAIQRQVCSSADVEISITFLHGKYSITFRCSYCFPEHVSRIPRFKIHDNVTNIIFPRNPIKSLVHIFFSSIHTISIWFFYMRLIFCYLFACISMSLLNSYRGYSTDCISFNVTVAKWTQNARVARSWWKL